MSYNAIVWRLPVNTSSEDLISVISVKQVRVKSSLYAYICAVSQITSLFSNIFHRIVKVLTSPDENIFDLQRTALTRQNIIQIIMLTLTHNTQLHQRPTFQYFNYSTADSGRAHLKVSIIPSAVNCPYKSCSRESTIVAVSPWFQQFYHGKIGVDTHVVMSTNHTTWNWKI